jgi:hypothetical protein
MGEYVALDKKFYNLVFKKEVEPVPSYFQIYVLIEFLEEAFIRIKIIIRVNYIIIIRISNNNAVINNNIWRIPIPYFSHQNYHGQAKGFLRTTGQFGHASLKVSPSLT